MPRTSSKKLAAEESDDDEGSDDNEDGVGKGVLLRKRKPKTLPSNKKNIKSVKKIKRPRVEIEYEVETEPAARKSVYK